MFSNSGYCLFLVVFKSLSIPVLITPLFIFSFFPHTYIFFSVASLTCSHTPCARFSLALEKSSFVSLHVGSRVKKTN